MDRRTDRKDTAVPVVKLRGGAELHRIINSDGDKMSVIRHHGIEVWSCYRGQEATMIKAWNRTQDD